MKLKVLFHVYNISGYLISELEELSKTADITVIETPCEGIGKGVLQGRARWIDRRVWPVDIGERPDVFFCGGWADREMVQLAAKLRRQGTKTVLLVDTPWQGRLKQLIHCLYSRFYLTRIFDFAWCAGAPQERYLRYLGFPLKRIRRGYYCADTKKFAPIGEGRIEQSKQSNNSHVWPHVFLYIGRYVEAKNMRRMERAFIKAIETMPESDWTLRCIGTGTLWDERTIHPRIEHLGYKSPAEIQNYVRDAGCFVLPSVYEPWGVVVHEAALMGLPMTCSNQVQATTAYLKDGENGFVFDPLDEAAIETAFLKIMRSSDAELVRFGRESFRRGLGYTTADWAKTAMEMECRCNKEALCG